MRLKAWQVILYTASLAELKYSSTNIKGSQTSLLVSLLDTYVCKLPAKYTLAFFFSINFCLTLLPYCYEEPGGVSVCILCKDKCVLLSIK
jgi:hypothetical protein